MKNLCYGLLIVAALFTLITFATGADDDCDSVFATIKALDTEINGKAREIAHASMHVEDESIRERLNETYPKYLEAQRMLGVARFLFDFTKTFEEAGVTVPGFTYENAGRIATVGINKLNAIVAELDNIAEDLKKLLDPDKAA